MHNLHLFTSFCDGCYFDIICWSIFIANLAEWIWSGLKSGNGHVIFTVKTLRNSKTVCRNCVFGKNVVLFVYLNNEAAITLTDSHSVSSSITEHYLGDTPWAPTRTDSCESFSAVTPWILTLYSFVNICQTWPTWTEASEKNSCESLLPWAISVSLEGTCFANSVLEQCRKVEVLRCCPELTRNCRRLFWLIIAAPCQDQNQSYQLN